MILLLLKTIQQALWLGFVVIQMQKIFYSGRTFISYLCETLMDLCSEFFWEKFCDKTLVKISLICKRQNAWYTINREQMRISNNLELQNSLFCIRECRFQT